MPAARGLLIVELDTALARTSKPRHAAIMRRVTDLFVRGAATFSDEHVELLGDVICRVMARSERPELVELSQKLAGIGNAPASVVTLLSHNDDIAVAGPVLGRSEVLSDAALIEVARARGRPHLLAIAGRTRLGESVTDALLDHGDIDVAQKVVENATARLSDFGFVRLIKWAKEHPKLATGLAGRSDVPAELQPFLELASA